MKLSGITMRLARRSFCASVVLFSAFSAINGYAGTITVSNSNDSGAGSLRDALASATDGDIITFNPSLFGDTIKLTSGEIVIDDSLFISGLGDDSTVISGNGISRIFRIDAAANVSIEKLTLISGMAADSGGAVYNNGILSLKFCTVNDNTAKFGGAFYNDSSLSISNCSLSNNFASAGQGGGVYSSNRTFTATYTTFNNNTSVSGGGAIANKGNCILENISITGNYSNRGGGIFSDGTLIASNSTISSNNANFGDGGGLLNLGTGRLVQCTIENNRTNNGAFAGGGIFTNSSSFQLLSSTINGNVSNGETGGLHNEGVATVISSTVSNNSASLSGGGIGNSGEMIINASTLSGNNAGASGGGIENSGELSINNSTLSGNEADSSGGGINNSRITTLSRCTVAFNDAAADGGGIQTSDSLLFSNTIIANNTAGGLGDEIYKAGGTVISLGHNLVRDIAQSGFNPGSGDVLGTTANPKDPLLGPLQNNGGSTLTHEPLCGSPAIDAGDPTGALSTDQRDSARIHGAGIDIGSVESQTDPVEIDAAIVNVSPPGNNNGSIELLISGGVEPYYITWNTGDSVYIITGLTAGNYTVTVEDFYGCSATAVFTVSEPTGINGVDNESITLYPNPASNYVFLKTDIKQFSLQVFDIYGRLAKTIRLPLAGFSLDDLSSGEYLLLMLDSSGRIRERSRFSITR